MVFPHNLIILMDTLSQPWALLTSKIFIIRKMSSSFIAKELNWIFVWYFKFGNLLGVLTGVHWVAKWRLKCSDSIWKSGISLPLTRTGVINGIFFLI